MNPLIICIFFFQKLNFDLFFLKKIWVVIRKYDSLKLGGRDNRRYVFCKIN